MEFVWNTSEFLLKAFVDVQNCLQSEALMNQGITAYPAKLTFKIYGEIRILHNTEHLKRFIKIKSALQKTLKNIPDTRKSTRTKNQME